MKVAVTYENGEVFQHFGHTPAFKLYEVEDGKVVSSEVLETECGGHDALAGLLADKDVAAVICGGIGDGAQAALMGAGIELCSGVSGNADEAVKAYLNGELISEGVNCDHHSGAEEEDGCGCGCGGDCGSGCGGCGGGCGGGAPLFDGPNAGKRVKAHYCGTFNDGTEFDSSYGGEPLEFICGMGMMIAGFDKAVATMKVGEIVNIHLSPEEAYGMPDPRAIFTVNMSEMPGAENLEVGQHIYLSDGRQPFPVTVTAKDETTITFDANHEMAGKELNFKIELVEVND